MVYANKTDLSIYMGVVEVDLPNDIDRVLRRASELIDRMTLNKIDTDNNHHLSHAKDAVCAQVEYWTGIDESMDIVGSPNRFSIGSFSYDGKLSKLAPRAERVLLLGGLMNTRVRMR